VTDFYTASDRIEIWWVLEEPIPIFPSAVAISKPDEDPRVWRGYFRIRGLMARHYVGQ
jgi:hypothetical protein